MFLQFKELQALLELRTTMHACNYSFFFSCICCKFLWDDFQLLRMYTFRQIWDSEHENTTLIVSSSSLSSSSGHHGSTCGEESKTLWRLAIHRCPPFCASVAHEHVRSTSVSSSTVQQRDPCRSISQSVAPDKEIQNESQSE